MTAGQHIFVVDDEMAAREMVGDYLKMHGFEVTLCDGGTSLRRAMGERIPDLVVLDLNMPEEDGLSIVRDLKSQSSVPIIMLTATASPIDRIVGLELGADDYLVKPYELREMLARVRSVLRRLPAETAAAPVEPAQAIQRRVLRFGDYRADLDSRTVTGPTGTIELAKSEFDVLEVFLSRPNRVLSRSAIFDAIGNQEDAEASRALDLRIMRLRRKIESDPANPQFLRTVRGEGYVFAAAVAAGPAA